MYFAHLFSHCIIAEEAFRPTSCNNIARRKKYKRFFFLSEEKNLPVLLNPKIEGGKGWVIFLYDFIQITATYCPVGGIGRRGERNGCYFSSPIRKTVHARWGLVEATQLQAMTSQLSAKEIFRAVFAVSAGKNQGVDGWVEGYLGDNIAGAHISHAEVRGIDLVTETGLDNIADADFLSAQKVLPLPHRFLGIVVTQVELKDYIQCSPQKTVAAAITEIDILFPEFTERETRRRQGADNKLAGPFGDEDLVWVIVKKNGFLLICCAPKKAIFLLWSLKTSRQGCYR
jgi:hypothetical protein